MTFSVPFFHRLKALGRSGRFVRMGSGVVLRVPARLSHLLCELLGLQLGHSVRPSRLRLSQVTQFAKASCVESARCFQLHQLRCHASGWCYVLPDL